MTEVVPGSRVRVVGGAFAGSTATVRAVGAAGVEVEVELFGRPLTLTLRPEEVEAPETDPRPRWRRELAADVEGALRRRLVDWWAERPDGAWDSFVAYRGQAEADAAEETRSRLADFDASFGGAGTDDAVPDRRAWPPQTPLRPAPAMAARWEAEADRWKPNGAAWTAATQWIRDGLRVHDPAAERAVVAESERQATVKRRRERAEYVHYRQTTLDPTEVRERRAAAQREADAAREPLSALVRATHGLVLPAHVFTFWAFWAGLTDVERDAVEWVAGLRPGGLLHLLPLVDESPTTRDGLDPRLNYRFYNDPPEFLTVLLGDSDGLHYGLWYDDPAHPADLVASYYSRDGSGIEFNGRTLLEAARERIEWFQFHLDHPTEDDPKARLAVRLARDAVTEFETADRTETGDAYLQLHRLRLDRVPTASEAGVRVDGVRAHDVETVRAAILADDPAVPEWVEAALRACADGNPTDALALGHDLHWLSGSDPTREAAADRLLQAAYRALGRAALVGICAVHHAHRDLRSVAVYRPG